MAKAIINPDFKKFNSIFETMAIKYGYFYIWEDFLNIFINSFCFNYHQFEDFKNYQKKYTKTERENFGKLIREVIFILDKKIIGDKDWYDFFGNFYEANSLSKKQGFAQFFTPEPICNFMSQILSPKNKEKLADPCCGSGRFSLASNSQNLGMFHFLVDLDYTCAKMAALNLMFHGINGIVICDDGLFPGKNFRGAFIVNRKLHQTGVPQIEFEYNKSKAYNYVRFNTMTIQDVLKTPVENKHNDFNDIKDLLDKSTGQYKLF